MRQTYQEWMQAEADRMEAERRTYRLDGMVDEATIRMVAELNAPTIAAIRECQKQLDHAEGCL